MWDDLLDLVGQLFQAVGDTPGSDRSPGPPIDLGTALALFGLLVAVGGIVLLSATHGSRLTSIAVAAIGVGLTCVGLRLTGR